MTNQLKLLLLGIITLAAILIVFSLKPIGQDPAYHHFADTRTWLGIPNFSNVISNFLFLIVGIKGLSLLPGSAAPKGVRLIYAVLFTAIFLVGLGSAWYHLHPDNDTLVYDRLPLTLIFMALLSATIGELVSPSAAVWLLFPLLAMGIGGVLWWHYTESLGRGDLRLYGFVQYYPALMIPLLLLVFPAKTGSRGKSQLIWVVVWYGVAKCCESFDRTIYLTLGFISGHSLKHLAAAVATWYLVRVFRMKYCSRESYF